MISAIRDNALSLACLSRGLPAVHGRGMDLLHKEVAVEFEGSLIRQLNSSEFSRAFRIVIQGLLSEIRSIDKELAGRLQATLMLLIDTPS